MEDVLQLGWKDEQERIRATAQAGLDVQSRRPGDLLRADQLQTLQQPWPRSTCHRSTAATWRSCGLCGPRASPSPTGAPLRRRRCLPHPRCYAGQGEADLQDLRWLAHLWTDPATRSRCAGSWPTTVSRSTNQAGRSGRFTRSWNVDLRQVRIRTAARSRTEQEFRELVAHACSGSPASCAATTRRGGGARRKVQSEQRETLTLLRERFPWRGTRADVQPPTHSRPRHPGAGRGLGAGGTAAGNPPRSVRSARRESASPWPTRWAARR